MSKSCAAALGVWLVLALGGGLAGCTGTGERLPECKGRAVPINAVPAAADASGKLSGRERKTSEVGEARAH
jgi:hypothetical protein